MARFMSSSRLKYRNAVTMYRFRAYTPRKEGILIYILHIHFCKRKNEIDINVVVRNVISSLSLRHIYMHSLSRKREREREY